MNEPYYSFNRYLQERFGERVHRISINAGFNCPNLDGTLSKDGCVYCNNKAFTINSANVQSIEAQIKDSISYYQRRFGIKKFIAYFQAFSNTYAPIAELKEKYDVIKKFPQIVGLFVSTRPDCVDEQKLNLLAQYSKDYLLWVEYGLQTTHDFILKEINRNHSYYDFLSALALARKHNINVGVHVILGLTSSRYEDMMQDAKRLSCLDIQGIKFHLLHILKGTAQEKLYETGKIKLLGKEDYVKIICDFLEYLPSSIVILRLISTALAQYLIAPSWMNDKAEVRKEIIEEFARRGTYQGYNFKRPEIGKG
jgi:radical SAM protein (TIGR01212 family)